MKKIPVKCFLVAAIVLGFSGVVSIAKSNSALPVADGKSITVSQARRPSVPFVTTPMTVVEKMLEMAEVDENDIVYDLGSGDGRIVIAAAQRGAYGIGIDINPERVQEGVQNAHLAGVADQVEFREQDIFKSDISQASVVTLYLLSTVNRQLRPKLLQELEPGTRVVSHAFSMGEWKPDRTASIRNNTIYYWVVPANVSGRWEWTADNPKGNANYRLELRQTFQKVTGTLVEDVDAVPIEDAELVGDQLRFSVTRPVNGRPLTTRYEVRVRKDQMEGQRISAQEGRETLSDWSARRDPDTITPLDRAFLLPEIGT
jgi:SAM-dependent methyltransferase